MWETLNVTDDRNPGIEGQNTGFYWLDQWKLYPFSVDESRFVHLQGMETVGGQKTFTVHPAVPATQNTQKVDKSGDQERTHYATQAQLAESALLLSGSNRGSDQTVGGTTGFAGPVYTTHDLEVQGKAEFTSTTQSVGFNSDITLPAKSAAAAQNVTTHPASEHQIYLAASANTTALNTHKTANPVDHPNQSVTTAKLAENVVTADKILNGAVEASKIPDEAVTAAKVQRIAADTTGTKAIFSATAVAFLAFLQTVWRGITWLNAKLHASSGHRHTGGTGDAPQIGTSGIADGAIVNADVSASAAIALSKVDTGTTANRVLAVGTTAGTPSLQQVTSAMIADGAVTSANCDRQDFIRHLN